MRLDKYLEDGGALPVQAEGVISRAIYLVTTIRNITILYLPEGHSHNGRVGEHSSPPPYNLEVLV